MIILTGVVTANVLGNPFSGILITNDGTNAAIINDGVNTDNENTKPITMIKNYNEINKSVFDKDINVKLLAIGEGEFTDTGKPLIVVKYQLFNESLTDNIQLIDKNGNKYKPLTIRTLIKDQLKDVEVYYEDIPEEIIEFDFKINKIGNTKGNWEFKNISLNSNDN
jgi:hypothetical protein